MVRRLFNVLTALSLLLCAAVVALWVRSYWVREWCRRVRTPPPREVRETVSAFGHTREAR